MKLGGAASLAIILATVMLAAPVSAGGFATWVSVDDENTSNTFFDALVGIPEAVYDHYGISMQSLGTYSYVDGHRPAIEEASGARVGHHSHGRYPRVLGWAVLKPLPPILFVLSYPN